MDLDAVARPARSTAPGVARGGDCRVEGTGREEDEGIGPGDAGPAAVCRRTPRVQDVAIERPPVHLGTVAASGDGAEQVVLGLRQSGLDESARLGWSVVAQPEPPVTFEAHPQVRGLDRLRRGFERLLRGQQLAVLVMGARLEGEVVAGHGALQLRDGGVLRELGDGVVERGRGVSGNDSGLVQAEPALAQRRCRGGQLGLPARQEHDRGRLPAREPGPQRQPVLW